MPKLHHDIAHDNMMKRRAKVYELRTSGMSYNAISKMLSIPISTVRKDMQAFMDSIPRENAMELRDMELDKLNRMELALQKKMLSGSPQAINTALRIMQHRAQLMGLDSIENNDGLDSAKNAMLQIIDALQNGPTAQPVEDEQSGD
ncbi:MAG: hypothetical protein E7J02_13465 [Staphylococcus warneri]|nr:hypothetical protein [Staphylococcus warneri]